MKISLKLTAIFLCICFTLAAFPFMSVAAGSATVDFDSAAKISLFSASNNVGVFYDASEDAARLYTTGTSDPFIMLNLQNQSLSASTYKYIVFTYRTLTTNSAAAAQTELFLCAGSTFAATGGQSVTFGVTNGCKYRSQIIDLSSTAYWSGSINGMRIDCFSTCALCDTMFIDSISFASSAAEAAGVASARTDAANGILAPYTEAELNCTTYNNAKYTKYYWDGGIIYNEAVYPLENADGTISPIPLMYNADRIVSVRSATLGTEYKMGVDYNIIGGKLQLYKTKSVKTIPYSTYYTSTQTILPCCRGGYMYFSEGSEMHLQQLAVTYVTDDEWTGAIPEGQSTSLPKTVSKLENKQNLNVLFYGDSITVGCNASGWSGLNCAPYSQTWYLMTVNALKAKYGYTNISYTNTAVGGKTAQWGAENANSLAAAYSPDLAFIAFGTNDGSMGVAPATFKAQIQTIITSIRAVNPNCEIILVAPILPNPEALVWSGIQGDYLPVLEELCGAGIVVADLTTVYRHFLTLKRYCDMTGNNVNHPNDFIVRLYSQTMLRTITEVNEKSYELTLDSAMLPHITPQSVCTVGDANDDGAVNAADLLSLKLYMVCSGSSVYVYAADVNSDGRINARDILMLRKHFVGLCILPSKPAETAVEYDSAESAVRLSTLADVRRPTALVDLSSAGEVISADDYNYAAISYKVSSVTATSAKVILTSDGSNVNASFPLTADGAYHTAVIDLTDAGFTGTIGTMTLEYFNETVTGDAMYISSVMFAESTRSFIK